MARVSPLRLGLAISAVLVAALLISETILDRWSGLLQEGPLQPFARRPGGILRDLRIAVVHCLLVGYLPAAFLHVLRSGRKTVLALQEALACTEAECRELADSIDFSRRGLLVAGLVGFSITFVTPFLAPPVPESLWNPATWSAEVAWHRTLGPILGWWTGWFVYAVFAVSRRLSRLAIKLSSVDLFDLGPLAPFTQQGLTNALLMVGFVSLSSLFLIESGQGIVVTLVGGVTLFVAGAALLMPMRGVQQRIRAAKENELEWLDAEIRGQKGALRSGEDRRVGEIADLAAYRSLVVRTREWPLNPSTYFRFALYMLIPLGSWAAGAVVERIVERFFF
jgi:hypothetical protein